MTAMLNTVAASTATALPWLDPAAWQMLQRAITTNLWIEGTRYLFAVLLLWLLLHVLLKRRLAHRVIKDWPTWRDMRRELAYSFSSMLVFAAMGCVVYACLISGEMEIYRNPGKYGTAWLLLSFPLMVLWHDFYFYWTHRLLHRPGWLRHVHGVHHRSRSPSPWAAYSFHPVEAFINGLVTPLALATVPLHWSVMLAFATHQIFRNAHGHAAVETMPRGFARHWLGGRFTTTTHHHLHHETAKGNYGLWFTWWDRWCGTERSDYLARFEAATPARPPRHSAAKAAVITGTMGFMAWRGESGCAIANAGPTGGAGPLPPAPAPPF